MSILNSDIIAEILKRVDGSTLATTACSSSAFKSIAFQEWLWENLCSSLWPSTQKSEIKQLISSLGGFRKFYGYCFPLLSVCCKHPVIDCNEDYHENFNGEGVDLDAVPVSSSDLVSLLDIHFNNKTIYSKVISADDLGHFHCKSCSIFPLFPFLTDHLCNCDGNIPSISINDMEREKDVDSRKTFLLDMMRLSWIVINKRTKRAVNLSSWRPLQARKSYWGCDNDFTVRFGSILPGDRNTLSLELIASNIVVSCRVRGDQTMNLQINEISMQLEDVVGNQVNESEGHLAIERAMKWERRSKEQEHIIQACRQVLEIQSEYNNVKEEKVQPIQRRTTPLPLLIPFVALAISYYCRFM
ncbi:hypothetical protein KI387_019293 [Taxus chinensis]|uniref:F-box protein n=1 Tax=Taxus chinensis TaxID=29808 RepID=A0AA38LA85_TAXCH|nr:hypothetical protein KI387_019293 [Taxus chinensis]